jgi:hypothetical protein
MRRPPRHLLPTPPLRLSALASLQHPPPPPPRLRLHRHAYPTQRGHERLRHRLRRWVGRWVQQQRTCGHPLLAPPAALVAIPWNDGRNLLPLVCHQLLGRRCPHPQLRQVPLPRLHHVRSRRNVDQPHQQPHPRGRHPLPALVLRLVRRQVRRRRPLLPRRLLCRQPLLHRRQLPRGGCCPRL